MTNTERGGLARKIHIRAMIALIDQQRLVDAHNQSIVATRLVADLLVADIAQIKTAPHADRLTIYGIAADSTVISATQLLRAWQVAARKFLETR